jgi:hypothetical protein
MNTITAALVLAMQMQESSGDPNKINKREGAYGILQIRQLALDDVNKVWGAQYVLTDFLGKDGIKLSVEALRTYGQLYGAKTPEQFARIWNGGPRGMEKRQTLAYWKLVQKKGARA